MYGTTPRQHEALVYITARLKEDGYSPSYEEIQDALGLRSKSGVHRIVSGLEERGLITRLPNRPRAIYLPDPTRPPPIPPRPTGYALSAEAERALTGIAEAFGISKTVALERAVLRYAELFGAALEELAE